REPGTEAAAGPGDQRDLPGQREPLEDGDVRLAHEVPKRSLAMSRRIFFWILPVEVFGRSANSIRLGTLYRARRSRAYPASASASTSARSVTEATGPSPPRSSGPPTTALSTTAGWLSSTRSTSTDAMFSPPETM